MKHDIVLKTKPAKLTGRCCKIKVIPLNILIYNGFK